MPIRKPDEDLFEESKMSFGEHLEELRKVLMKALIGVSICCIVGFYFADQVVDFLTVPLDRALKKYTQGAAVKEIQGKNGYLGPELEPWLDDGLAPQQVLLDPGQLVNSLRKVSPDFLSDVDLTPYLFTADNFDRGQVPAFCKALSEHTSSLGQAVQDRQKLLWSKLPADDQATVKQIAQASEVSDSQFAEFLNAMNRLANIPDLVEAEVFQELLIKPPYSIWDNFKEKDDDSLPDMYATYKENPDVDLNRRLNRVLITRQFPDMCNELRLDLIALEMWEDVRVGPQSLTATEPFMIWVKAGVVTGLLLASPWIFFQLWTFVAAGLYGHERKYVYLYMPISLGLFFAGVVLAFGFVFDPVLDFLFTFNSQMGIAPIPRVADWLSFVLFLPIGFGLAFQLPLLMLFLHRIGIFQIEDYLTKWRVAVMVIFFLSMLLTPADPISMILLAVPLTLLYFLGIAMCKWMPKGKNPFDHVPES
jgi:sec-independent protein translocase protein TatC